MVSTVREAAYVRKWKEIEPFRAEQVRAAKKGQPADKPDDVTAALSTQHSAGFGHSYIYCGQESSMVESAG